MLGGVKPSQRRMPSGHQGRPRVADLGEEETVARVRSGEADTRVARGLGAARGITHPEEHQLVLCHGRDRRHRALASLTTPL